MPGHLMAPPVTAPRERGLSGKLRWRYRRYLQRRLSEHYCCDMRRYDESNWWLLRHLRSHIIVEHMP